MVALRTYKTRKEAANALGISHDTLEARVKEFEIGEVKSNKVLLWDLETGGINALQADLGFVLVFGWKWLGSNKVHTWKVSDYPNWFSKESGINDKPLLKDIVKIMESADLLVAHYGDKFDRRFFQGRCAIHNLSPPPPTKQRDTWRIAKTAFKFGSNRLANLAETLDLGEKKHQKTHDEWPGWWFKAMAGNENAINAMAVYCAQDVKTLEQVYLRIRQYDNPHPALFDDRTRCSVCGSEVEYNGTAHVGVYTYNRYQCLECGRWGRDRKSIKEHDK